MVSAGDILTVVYVVFIEDIHLHKPDQHARQNTQEVQVCSGLTHLIVGMTGMGKGVSVKCNNRA